MRYVLLLVGALTLAVLAWSYQAASIGPLMTYMDAVSANTPACRVPAVVASLRRSLDSTGHGRSQAALSAARTFQPAKPEGQSHGNRLIISAQRELWLWTIADGDRLAQAYCAIGIAGKDYDLPSIGAIVGIDDITRADPRALQALTDVYVYLHYRAPVEQIRQRYRDQLRKTAG